MEELALITRLDAEHYESFYGRNADELFVHTKRYLPIRLRFDAYLAKALASPQKRISIVAPEPEDDYFEVILGSSRTVVEYVLGDHIKALQQTKDKLDYSNQWTTGLINKVIQGSIQPDQLKALLKPING